jgi:hypothetical protein
MPEPINEFEIQNRMKEWEDFLTARKNKLESIRPMRQLLPEVQAGILEKGIQTGYEYDVMEYLMLVENPSQYGDLPVAEQMIQALGDLARSSNVSATTAKVYLQSLLKSGRRRDEITAVLNRKPTEYPVNGVTNASESSNVKESPEAVEKQMEMKPLIDIYETRRAYEKSISAFNRLSPRLQAEALSQALKKSQNLDVFAYLLAVENPSQPGIPRPISELMVKWLVDVATFPGENSPIATDLVVALTKEGRRVPEILALLDLKAQECFKDPKDDEIWLYTAILLREIDSNRYEKFLQNCRDHEAPNIKAVAAFFDE